MKTFHYFLLFLLLLFSNTASVAYADEEEQLEAETKQISKITRRLDRGNYDQDDLNKWTKITIKVGSRADVCIADKESAIKKIQESIDALGEKTDDETKSVTQQRKQLQEEKDKLDKKLAECNLLKLNSSKAGDQISLAEKSYFKEKYLIRGPHIYTLTREYLKNPFGLIADSGTFFWKHAGVQHLNTTLLVMDILIVILMVFIGIWIRRFLWKLEGRIEWLEDDFSENFARAAVTTFAQYAPWLFGASTVALISYIITRDITPTPFITTFSIGLLIYLALIAVIRFIFSPVKPARTFIDFTPGIAEKISRRFHIIALVSFLGYMAFYTVFSESIPELNRLLLRDIFFVIVRSQSYLVVCRSVRIAEIDKIPLVVFYLDYRFRNITVSRMVRLQKFRHDGASTHTRNIRRFHDCCHCIKIIPGPVQCHG